jgi:hypothetical protein
MVAGGVPPGPRAGSVQYLRDQRLHDAGGAAPARRSRARCDERRHQGGCPDRAPALRGRGGEGLAQLPAGPGGRRLAGGHHAGHPRRQRPGRDAARHRKTDRRRPGSGGPLARQRLLPRLSLHGPAHTRGHPGTGVARGQRGRPGLCLSRQRAGAPAGKHLLPPVWGIARRPPGVGCDPLPAGWGAMPRLWPDGARRGVSIAARGGQSCCKTARLFAVPGGISFMPPQDRDRGPHTGSTRGMCARQRP